MTHFVRTVLFTDTDGRARFREETVALDHGNDAARLSAPMPASNMQWRKSPIGFRSEFHVTTQAQWVFVLQGQMEIGLQDGTAKVFKAGEHFFSADVLPEGVVFDDKVHGHRSRQLGDEALVTVFIRP